MTERDDKTRAAVIADTHAWRLARVVETLQNHGYTDGPEWVRNAAQEIERLRAALAILGEDCETCKGDPNVCATVPGLRHCEKANREPATSSSAARRTDAEALADLIEKKGICGACDFEPLGHDGGPHPDDADRPLIVAALRAFARSATTRICDGCRYPEDCRSRGKCHRGLRLVDGRTVAP